MIPVTLGQKLCAGVNSGFLFLGVKKLEFKISLNSLKFHFTINIDKFDVWIWEKISNYVYKNGKLCIIMDKVDGGGRYVMPVYREKL